MTFFVAYGVLYWAEQWVPSGLAAVLFATSPLWVTLAAHLALPGEAEPPTVAPSASTLCRAGDVALACQPASEGPVTVSAATVASAGGSWYLSAIWTRRSG